MSDIIDEFEEMEAEAIDARKTDARGAHAHRNLAGATKRRRFAPGHKPVVDTSERRPQPSLPRIKWLERPDNLEDL